MVFASDDKESGNVDGHSRFLYHQRRLLAAASVAAHELIDTTGGVNELALTRVEGV